MEIEHKQKMLAVAEAQKHLLWAVLAQLPLPFLEYVLPRGISLVLLLAAFAYSLWAIYKIARALGSSYAWLVTVATAIPCVGLIMLLVMNDKATKFLQASGIKVGFMGANAAQVASLRQDIVAASVPLPMQH